MAPPRFVTAASTAVVSRATCPTSPRGQASYSRGSIGSAQEGVGMQELVEFASAVSFPASGDKALGSSSHGEIAEACMGRLVG